MSDLPLPDPEAAAHSARVVAHIRAAIEAAGGFLPFSRYMELALYAPGLGYYAAGATKLGGAGDFVTAPEMTPLYATALARQVAEILDVAPGREIVELGAGSGRLAADLLNALAAGDALPSRYAILEPSPDLRERQRATIARDAAAHARARRLARRVAGGDRRRGRRERSARRAARARGRAPRRRMVRARRALGRAGRAIRLGGATGRRVPWPRSPRSAFRPAATT